MESIQTARLLMTRHGLRTSCSESSKTLSHGDMRGNPNLPNSWLLRDSNYEPKKMKMLYGCKHKYLFKNPNAIALMNQETIDLKRINKELYTYRRYCASPRTVR